MRERDRDREIETETETERKREREITMIFFLMECFLDLAVFSSKNWAFFSLLLKTKKKSVTITTRNHQSDTRISW